MKNEKAGYSLSSISDAKSITVLEGLLNLNKVIPHLNKHDKIPNHDGNFELINSEGAPIGEIRVQVKTLRKNYKTPSYPVEFRLLRYVVDACQIPFILIAVDQNLKKAYWKFLSKDQAEILLRKREKLKKNQATISIRFDEQNEISKTEPYSEWENIVQKNIQSISGYTRSRKIVLDVNPLLPYVDQVHSFIEKLYSELNFIPPHILASALPILGNNSYYGNFNLEIESKELFDLFKSLLGSEIGLDSSLHDLTNNVENHREKLQFIVNKLSNNLISKISRKGKHVNIDTLNSIKSCDCLRCKLKKLKFDEVKGRIHYDGEDIEEIIICAYTNYKLGNYVWSAEQFLKAREIAIDTGKHLTKFIIQYNLSKLNLLLSNNGPAELIEQVKAVDIDKEFRNYDDEVFFPIVDWIYREKYLHTIGARVRELSEKLKVQYHSSVRGGTSYNNYVNLLNDKMAEVESFLQHNFIIYDEFLEYTELIREFSDGIFASYATKGKENAKLEHFNDWHLGIIINYSDPSQIITLFNRYKLKELNYKASEIKGKQIHDFMYKLVGEFNVGYKIVKDNFQEDNTAFLKNQSRLIRNVIVLCGQCKFRPEVLSKMTKLIIKYATTFGQYDDIKYLEYFFARNGKYTSSNDFKKMLLAIIKNPKFHQPYFFESISTNAKSSGKVLLFSEKEFAEIQKDINAIRSHDKNQNFIYLVHLHSIIDNVMMKECIEKFVIEVLNSQFDFDLFSAAAIFDVITLQDYFLVEAIKKVKPQIQTTGPLISFYKGDPHERYFMLSSLINICFKENVDFNDPKFDSLRGLSDYYDWLLDMDKFDYNLFDPQWINEYGTMYYFRRMYQSNILKQELEEFLGTDQSFFEQNTMNNYLNIYVRKSWRLKEN